MTLTWLLWRMFDAAMFLLFWLLLSLAGVAASARPAQQPATIPPEVEADARALVRELAGHTLGATLAPRVAAGQSRIAEWITAQKPGS